MMLECTRPDCAVAESGTCVLNHELSSCPHRTKAAEPEQTDTVAFPNETGFPGSRACTLGGARGLMAERYVHIVGILGEPNAGKTACLVSLYLSVSQRSLDGFYFADSRTLMGFEEISQAARQWNKGQVPEQFTERTELTDDRTAGFLHIRLAYAQQGNLVDLLCSDLPGEWTTALIDQNRIDRLEFLKRADAIWLVVDGTELAIPASRQVCIQRITLAIGRLGDFLSNKPRLLLVITRRDQKTPDERVLLDLCAEGTRHGFETEAVAVASFSDNEDVAPGTGIARLIERTTEFEPDYGATWEPVDADATFESPKIGLVRRESNES